MAGKVEEREIELSEVQKTAVETVGQNLLVGAGAGAGKTRVLVERFLYFLRCGKAGVSEILALTFTDKAANEMKERIMKRLSALEMHKERRELEASYISTLHAFAVRLLKDHPVEAAIHPDFGVLESEEAGLFQEQAMDQAIEKDCAKGSGTYGLLKIYGEKEIRTGVRKVFRQARVEGFSLAEFFAAYPPAAPDETVFRSGEALFEKLGEPDLARAWKAFLGREWEWKVFSEFQEWTSGFSRKRKEGWPEAKEMAKSLAASRLEKMAVPLRADFEKLALQFEAFYEARKAEEGALDFDDLLVRAFKLLTADRPGNKKVLERYRSVFKFILVDEFQDVNPLQMKLIRTLSSGDNLFMVGDSKQSIYGFRGTTPVHFMNAESEYKKGKGGRHISMLENYRSAPETLEFINQFFKKLWEEDGFEYEPLAPREKESGVPAELLAVEKREGEGLDQARMREARMIAGRMTELHQEGVSFGSMAVLFQTMTHAGIYEHALKAAGIPYFAVSSRGFYHQAEIRDMMSLLACLENPLLDIQLAAVLRSPFFGVLDDTLFWLARSVKKDSREVPLYEGFRQFEDIPQIKPAERAKLRAAKSFFEELLLLKDRLRLAELLDWILQKTSYEWHALASRQGTRKFANLKKLVQLARDYERHDLMSLSDFIRTIRHLEASAEAREAEAQVEAEESGRVVRLMTIHAAKGLEFDTCFVADLANRAQSPESRTFMAQAGQGYAFRLIHPEDQESFEPLSYMRIYQETERRESEEWKRLFYVAATRAKKRLIFSGVHEEKRDPKTSFREMSSWMDWVMALKSEVPVTTAGEKDSAHAPLALPPVLAEKEDFQNLLSGSAPLTPEEPDYKRAREIFDALERREMPYSRVIDLPVSAYSLFSKNPEEFWRIYEIGYSEQPMEKREEPSEDDVEPEISAADFGTLFHLFLERLDFREAAAQSEKILADIFSPAGPQSRLQAEKIAKDFLGSPLFAKIRDARRVFKEIPFVLNERHGKIHGILDLLYQDAAGAWHIVDYKTAEGDEKKAVQAGYDLQIQLYAAAFQQITGQMPASGVVYFLKNHKTHETAFSAASLRDALIRIRDLQEEILEFSRKKAAAEARASIS